MTSLFWVALFGAVYSYTIYPAVLWLLLSARGAERRADRPVEFPAMTVIITARNEVEHIGAKIQDVLAQQYSGELEVIVVSDASDDETDARVLAVTDPRVRLVRQERRLGKEAGQACAIRKAAGEVLVFTDVATRIQSGSLPAIAARLADPVVGAVSSEDRFVTVNGQLAGEGLYIRYEMWLRRLESRMAGLVGLSGSFFAVRKHICDSWPTEVPSDFTVAFNSARRGLKAVSDLAVVGIYPDLREATDEYARKRRTVLRGMAGLAAAREVLNPFRYGAFALQVWSHKVMRWAVPWFLAALLLTSAVLARTGAAFQVFLLIQLAGYAIVVAAWQVPALRRAGPIRVAYYFVQVNVAMADALLRFLRGERIPTWSPSRR